MHEYKSLLADTAPAFIDFMIASKHWNEDYEKRFIAFDNYSKRQNNFRIAH